MSGTNQLGISNPPVGLPQFVASLLAPSHGRSSQLKRYQRKMHARRAGTINRLLAQPVGIGLPVLACAVQRRRFPVGASPTRQPLQPEAIGAVMEVTKWLKPSSSVSRIGDSASVQAATRVSAPGDWQGVCGESPLR